MPVLGVVPLSARWRSDDEDSLTGAVRTASQEDGLVGYCGDPPAQDLQFYGFPNPLEGIDRRIVLRYVQNPARNWEIRI